MLGLASALLIAGCGSVAGIRASPSPVPATSLELTDTDVGKTFQVQVGQVVSVTLHQPGAANAWSSLRSTNSSVLAQMVDTRRLSARGVTLGKFKAMAAGKAELQATSSEACPPPQVCPDLMRLWSVTIQVT